MCKLKSVSERSSNLKDNARITSDFGMCCDPPSAASAVRPERVSTARERYFYLLT